MTSDHGPSSSVNSWNADYVEQMYGAWRRDPNSVAESWRHFFSGYELAQNGSGSKALADEKQWGSNLNRLESLQSHVDSLIYHYRDLGHLIANLDPLGRSARTNPLLELEAFNLSEDLMDMVFHAVRIPYGEPRMTLREIIDTMERTYCGSIGVEYMDIQNTPERRWLQYRMERQLNQPELSIQEKMRILECLMKAVRFERFLHTNYVGQKRFSLEGSETLIPLLDSIINEAAECNVSDVVLGMAHRGRLNVLANILHKSYEQIFTEFEDNYQPGQIMGDGDVKYHKGYSSTIKTPTGREIYMTLTANPSHLEAVNPVVLGRVRAKQRALDDKERIRTMGLLIHGDAAFAGQGMVAETLNLSQLQGYRTGGTIHVIVNNQIGFTTSPKDGRSGNYCTDVAKMIQAPIFHVNGDDPEACIHVAKLAVEFRQKFKKDVVIDMYCFRRFGHNEGDDPSFTQPKLYDLIKNHPNVYDIYSNKLVEEQSVTREEIDKLEQEAEKSLEEAQERSREQDVQPGVKPFQKEWENFTHVYSHDPVDTGVERAMLRQVADVWTRYPENFEPNRKIKKLLQKRADAILDGEAIDWATAESLAFGTLLAQGTPVRLSGQDSRRATFSHRHAVVWDINTAEMHIPLNTVSRDQARFCVYDSPLSEAGVLGFDYGYSLADPNMLICWEAQFGDFANGAQVIIDQFIASSESKWNRVSGITLLLPHGYEGQGPEHSSGWLERFLQLSAEDNMQVVNCTTPAQYFHVLRRQMMRNFRKPLVIMTPKSLLRHPRCTSPIEDFSNECFHEVLDDAQASPEKVARVVLCSGKVYYDLLQRREDSGNEEVAIVRLEQFYPFPKQQLQDVLDRYPNASQFIWCQEEPENRGGWTFVAPMFHDLLGIDLERVSRPRSASPAVGSLRRHLEMQERLVTTAVPSPGANEGKSVAEPVEHSVQ